MGVSLIQDALKSLRESGLLRTHLESLGHSVAEQNSFADALEMSAAPSIDRFLETNPSLVRLGKRVIAAMLMPLETDDKLKTRKDWISALVEILVTADPEDFRENKLKLITFNFDRSFERALYLRLSARYHHLRQDQVATLVSSVPIEHVHGILGLPSWLSPEGRGRPYDGANVTAAAIGEVADRIDIYSDMLPADRRERIAEWLNEAERIVILGFGFLANNLRKTLMPESLRSARSVFATCYGLNNYHYEAVRSLFESKLGQADEKPAISFVNLQCHDFFQRFGYFIDDGLIHSPAEEKSLLP